MILFVLFSFLDVFLPCPDNLLVNLHESRDLVRDLLGQLPGKFIGNAETGSALGAALQASFKLMVSDDNVYHAFTDLQYLLCSPTPLCLVIIVIGIYRNLLGL